MRHAFLIWFRVPQVRTRIYFTSESHIHSLISVLRFCNIREGYEVR